MDDTSDRRRFIGMSLAAAGMGVANRVAAAVADRVGAESAPRTYLVVYSPGPAWTQGLPMRNQGLREHGQYMLGLYEKGILRFAGGFGDDSGGAAAFDASDDAAARALIDADPAVIARKFDYDLHPWTLVDWASLVKARQAR
jgi:uncharacterized protein YciI